MGNGNLDGTYQRGHESDLGPQNVDEEGDCRGIRASCTRPVHLIRGNVADYNSGENGFGVAIPIIRLVE